MRIIRSALTCLEVLPHLFFNTSFTVLIEQVILSNKDELLAIFQLSNIHVQYTFSNAKQDTQDMYFCYGLRRHRCRICIIHSRELSPWKSHTPMDCIDVFDAFRNGIGMQGQ